MSDALTVGVATWRRPESLNRLLEGLSQQTLLREPGARILVVDNDAAGSARHVVRSWSSLPLDYVVEPRPGICAARNRVLDEAEARSADWLAFIDDDEIPEPQWLARLVTAQRKHQADIVAGPVVPEFVKTPPSWIVRGRFFERPRRPTGTELPYAFTGNVLFRLRLAWEHGVRFPETLNFAGGEDRHFFGRLARAGARIVWADDAVVVEAVPPDRMTAEWLVRRLHRVGTSTAWIARDLDPGLPASIRCIGLALQWFARAGAHYVFAPIGGHHHRVEAERRFAYGVGLCQGALGTHLVQEYARKKEGR